LICCENESASVYKGFSDGGRLGVHHVGLMPENYIEACEACESMGLERAFERENSETSLVCFDTVKATGQCARL